MAWAVPAVMGAGMALGFWNDKKMSKKQKREAKKVQRTMRHLNPYDFLPRKLVKKGDYNLKKISGHNKKKYYKEIRRYKKADKAFRKYYGFAHGAKGRYGNNAFGLGPMGGGMFGAMTGKEKKLAWFARRRKYKDYADIRKYEREAAKGKNVRYVSPFNKEQQKLMKFLPEAFMKNKKAFDITKNPLFQKQQEAIMKGLKEKAPHLEKRSMKATKKEANRMFEREIAPNLAQQFANAGLDRSGALATALADAKQKMVGQLAMQNEEQNYARKQYNIENILRNRGLRQDLLGKGLLFAQAPIENKMNLAQMAMAQAPNQPYFLNPPVMRQNVFDNAPQNAMPPMIQAPMVGGGGQRGPGFGGVMMNALAGAAGQAAGQLGVNALQNAFNPAAGAGMGVQRMGIGGMNAMGGPAPAAQNINMGGFNNLGIGTS